MSVLFNSSVSTLKVGSSTISKAYLGTQQIYPISSNSLTGWYDASDSSTITVSSTRVSEWRDKSPLGNHLYQSTLTYQPYYTTTKNGLNTVFFNSVGGAVNYLTGSGFSALTIIAAYYDSNSIYSSGSPRGLIGSGYLINTGNSVATPAQTAYPLNTRLMNFGNSLIAGSSTNNWMVSHHIYNGTNSVVATNLDSDITGSAGTSGIPEFTTGINYYNRYDADGIGFMIGEFAEIIMYNRIVSRSERENIVNYLAKKWNITI